MSEKQLTRIAVENAVVKIFHQKLTGGYQGIYNLSKTEEFTSLQRMTAELLVNQGFRGVNDRDGTHSFDDRPEEALFAQTVWRLITLGLLYPQGFSPGDQPTKVVITEYGNEVFKENRLDPYDPEGYIFYITDNNEFIDNDLLIYLQEAVSTFNNNQFFSSVVMTGIFAEGLLDLLADEIKNSDSDPEKGKKWHNGYLKNHAYGKYEKVFNRLANQVISHAERDLVERFSSEFSAIGGIIRRNRNEAGHPTGVKKEWRDARAVLMLIQDQSKLIADLINWLRIEKNIDSK